MSYAAFSSEVELRLVVGGETFVLSHTNADDVILRETAVEKPPSNAELIVTVDGVERRRSVHLPDGISSEEKRVFYQPVDC